MPVLKQRNVKNHSYLETWFRSEFFSTNRQIVAVTVKMKRKIWTWLGEESVAPIGMLPQASRNTLISSANLSGLQNFISLWKLRWGDIITSSYTTLTYKHLSSSAMNANITPSQKKKYFDMTSRFHVHVTDNVSVSPPHWPSPKRV